MKLIDFLTRENLSHSEFAKRIERSVSTVSRLARELTYPDWPTMAAIEKATGGAVTPNDFRRAEHDAAPQTDAA